MQTEAIFENIAERLQEEISKANKSIYIAIAWFTNKDIFDKLIIKSKQNCKISVIISNDEINNNSRVDYDKLHGDISKVWRIGNGASDLMHNKFCVIDNSTVITGSYNWSYKAESNYESIIIADDAENLAKQFINEFYRIININYPDEKQEEREFPLDKVIKRLDIISNYIYLEDTEELQKCTYKLKLYDFNSDINDIVELINNEDYAKATNHIQAFISESQQITVRENPEVIALKLELKVLENRVNAFSDEKIELENIILDFQNKYSKALGEDILKLLELKKHKYINDEEKYNEYTKYKEEYEEQFDIEKTRELHEINNEQKDELKSKYRRASTLCHPDKFFNEPESIRKQAEQIFKELNIANSNRDLKRVSEILVDLENGILRVSTDKVITDKIIIERNISEIKRKISVLESEIINIRKSDTYKLIKDINDWKEYFLLVKEDLQLEIETLQIELGLEINNAD